MKPPPAEVSVLAVPGVALAVAGLFHPTSLSYPTAERWMWVHVVGLFVFPLVGAALMRLHYNPLAPWIWIGALIMAAGGGLSLLDRRARVGAPARAKLHAAVA